MPFASCIITGRRGTFRLSNPAPRPVFSRTGIDELTDYWHSDALVNAALTPGVAHPLYPGTILDDATFEEEVPEFPVSPELPAGLAGSYTVECKWRGDLRGTKPTKVINRGTRQTLTEGWDERTRRVISWHVEPKAITGTASTDGISCAAHGFSDGQKVYLPELTGGTGLTAGSVAALGTLYYVINATADAFQLSTALAGSAVNFTTDISAGKIHAAEFARWAQHPDFPYLFLCDIAAVDDNTDWKTADLTYRGLESEKPYARAINGAVTTANSQFSGYTSISADIFENFPPTDSGSNATLSGTDMDIEYDAASISLSDTYLSTSPPPTEYVGKFWTPPDAPTVSFITLYGVGTKYFFPFGWKCTSINAQKIPGRTMWLITVNHTYQPATIPTT